MAKGNARLVMLMIALECVLWVIGSVIAIVIGAIWGAIITPVRWLKFWHDACVEDIEGEIKKWKKTTAKTDEQGSK